MKARCNFPNLMNMFSLIASGLFAAAPAFAMNACVNSPLTLAIALSVAQNNGEDDFIQLEVGTYLLGGEVDYIATPTETKYLILSGGWAPGCFVRASSGSTVLDGQNAVRPLYIAANGQVTINFITFQHGNPALNTGGALNLSGPANAILAVDYNTFVSNHSDAGGAAIYVASAGTMALRNNLVFANMGSTTIDLYNNGNADVNNNTIVGNQLANHIGLGALYLTGTGTYYLSNNIMWGNEGRDLYDQNGTAFFTSNDIGVRDGAAPAGDINGLSVDPQFDGFLSVVLKPASPLVNAGYDTPYGGIGNVDLAGNPRLTGRHVDIGAFETDVLFLDGFQ